MVIIKNKKGAIELSMSTIVVLVLAMSMLVLGLILIRTIFSGATGAVDRINDEVLKGIDDTLSNSDAKIAIYPSVRKIEIKQGTQGEGFAFSIRNTALEEKEFVYTVAVDESFDISGKCRINAAEADSWLDVYSGSFTLAGSSKMDLPELVTYTIPSDAPSCTIPFIVEIKSLGEHYTSGSIRLTVKVK